MILADSSVWIDYFRGSRTSQVEVLVRRIAERDALVGDLVLAEVLQGFRSDREVAEALEAFASFWIITISGGGIAIAAARNYRQLRARGITVRKTIDCLIATRCIVDALPLLYSDRDFDPFVEHLRLQAVAA